MKEASNKYAVAALKERRAEIDGEVLACRQRLDTLTETIIHLDASIALFDPTYDPASMRPKRSYRRAKLFGGRKLSGLILDALRRAERPLSTQEVVASLCAQFDRGAGAPLVTKRVGMGLARYARRGLVTKEGARKAAHWQISSP